jgi:hypothetical protein
MEAALLCHFRLLSLTRGTYRYWLGTPQMKTSLLMPCTGSSPFFIVRYIFSFSVSRNIFQLIRNKFLSFFRETFRSKRTMPTNCWSMSTCAYNFRLADRLLTVFMDSTSVGYPCVLQAPNLLLKIYLKCFSPPRITVALDPSLFAVLIAM